MSKSLPLPPQPDALVTLQADDVNLHPTTQSSNNTQIEILGKKYDFSDEMIRKYPKLLDAACKYTINFDAILPLIYDYPPSCIPQGLLDEDSEKEIFLSNCEFFGIQLSSEVILHLNKKTKEELSECQEFIEKQAGKKGKKKVRFSLKKDVQNWCYQIQGASKELYDGLKPLEILQMLEAGSLDILAIHDFRGKNCVRSFLRLFMEKFLQKSS